MDESFIIQTAHDYDMPINEVRRIATIYPDDFYNQLEYYISNRQS